MASTNYRQSIKHYLDDLSQKGYQPGGGSAGALAFCLGASLLIKSIRHSIKKSTTGRKKNKLENRLRKLIFLKKKVFPYIDKDGELFLKFMRSKRSRKPKDLDKMINLIKNIIRASREAFFLAKEIESDIKKGIKSDFCLGLEFIKISELSALLNLEENKKMLNCGKKVY